MKYVGWGTPVAVDYNFIAGLKKYENCSNDYNVNKSHIT